MHLDRKTALLGKKFTRPYLTGQHPMTKKEAGALAGRDLPAGTVGWTLRADTQLVVAGDDADPDVVATARQRGLPVESPADWLGFGFGAAATSIAGYLEALLAEGFRFTTACNEADSSAESFRRPLVPYGQTPRLPAALAEQAKIYGREAVDTLNTMLPAVAEHFGARLSASSGGPLANSLHPLGPNGPWCNVASHAGFRGFGPVHARRADRIIPGETLWHRVGTLGFARHTTFWYRLHDAPVEDNKCTAVAFGGLEKDAQTVSFGAVLVVHT